MRSLSLIAALAATAAIGIALSLGTDTPDVHAEDTAEVHRDVDGWIFEDLDAAYTAAAETGKPLLVAFR